MTQNDRDSDVSKGDEPTDEVNPVPGEAPAEVGPGPSTGTRQGQRLITEEAEDGDRTEDVN